MDQLFTCALQTFFLNQRSDLGRVSDTRKNLALYRWIHADVIVYIFAHLHTALRIEGNMLDMNWLQAAKELVKLSTR